jgi:RNA polymerase-interacting CarD/CdnL/TRCF family regulator
MESLSSKSSNNQLQDLITCIQHEQKLLDACNSEIQKTNTTLLSGQLSRQASILAIRLMQKQSEREQIDKRIEALYTQAHEMKVYEQVVEQLNISAAAHVLQQSADEIMKSSRSVQRKKSSCFRCIR